MKTKEFVKKYTGKGVNYDNAYGNQCVDLFRFYCREVLKITQPKGVVGAKDFFEKFEQDPILVQNFKKVINTPEGVPNEGDVMIWKATKGNPYGHIAICLSADKNKFISFDQNWNNVQKCLEITHDYKNVHGWLSPLQISNDMKPTEKLPQSFYEIREFKQLKERKLVEGNEAFDTLMSLLLAENTHRNDAVNELQKQINLFEEQKKGWEETKKTALESQKKEFEKREIEMARKIYDLEAQQQVKPTVSTSLPTSAKYSFNTKDLVAWLKNIGLFGMLPLAITFLISLTGTIPTNTVYGVIGIALINALIDFIKKLLSENGDIRQTT